MIISPKKLQTLFILVWFAQSTLLSCLSASYGAARPYFNDYEKIKHQAIINSFKAKMISLLGIKMMPDSVFVSNMTNLLPEPIVKDEHYLNKIRSNSMSRKVRNKEIKNYVYYETKSADDTDDLNSLNGSIIQQMTLLPEKLEDQWCNELLMDMGPSRHRHHHRRTSFVTINCMSFDLSKNKEFNENEITSANLYIRINLNKHLNYDFATHIYLEVNGILIKRINLIKLDDNEQETDRYGFAAKEPVFESADVRKIVKELLARNKEPLIKIKVLFKNDFIDADVAKLREIFSDLNENTALHVKFGPAKNSKKFSKRNIHNKKQNSSQNQNSFKDCSELRRSGFESSNFSCCRESFPISMEEIGWSHFIIEPKIIEYKYCRGSCLYGTAQVFSNTNIVYKSFEIQNSFETPYCCNIKDYDDEITIIYGTPPNYVRKSVSINAKTCMCS